MIKRSLAGVTVSLALTWLGCSDPAQQSTRPTTQNSQGGGGSGGVAQPSGGTAGQGGTVAGGSAGATSAGSAGTGGSGGAGGSGGSGGGGNVIDTPEELLYFTKCAVCHGPDGVGITTPELAGPEIQHPVRDHTRWVVRNGLPGVGYKDPMEEWYPVDQPAMQDELIVSDAEMEMIFDYLDTPPQPTTGQGLYVDYCGNCHGADGKGGPTTRDVTTPAALAELVAVTRAGTHPGEQELRNEYMPAMDQTILTDAELTLISDYISTTLAP